MSGIGSYTNIPRWPLLGPPRERDWQVFIAQGNAWFLWSPARAGLVAVLAVATG